MSIDDLSLNEIIGSTIAQMVQWGFIVVMGFLLRQRGHQISLLNDRTKDAIGIVQGLFSKVHNLRPEVRQETKDLIRQLAEEISDTGVANFNREQQKIAILNRLTTFWERYSEPFMSIDERAEERFTEFLHETGYFLDAVLKKKAATRELQSEFFKVRNEWRRFFECVYADFPLSQPERMRLLALTITRKAKGGQFFAVFAKPFEWFNTTRISQH